MNVEESIQNLRLKGVLTEVLGDDKHNIVFKDGDIWQMSSRELVKLSRDWMSKRGTQDVKHFGNRKNRSATRDLINSEEWDKIPDKNNKVSDDDIWSWD